MVACALRSLFAWTDGVLLSMAFETDGDFLLDSEGDSLEVWDASKTPAIKVGELRDGKFVGASTYTDYKGSQELADRALREAWIRGLIES